jgi:hypothetical protein
MDNSKCQQGYGEMEHSYAAGAKINANSHFIKQIGNSNIKLAVIQEFQSYVYIQEK